MPYFVDQNLEDDKNKDPSQVQISGASPTTQPAGTGAQQSGDKKDLVTGSGFQNLDKYLQTNQSQDFGNQVLGKVQGEVQSAQDNQTKAAEKFGQQVQGANQLPTTEQVNSAIANPTAADPTQFQSWMKESYTGPKSLAEAPDAWNQYWSGANKANTSAQLLGTEAGRFSLLDSYFGKDKPNYNFGEKSLDNLLVQQSGLGKETRDVQNQATQLQSKGQEQALQLQNQAAQRAGEVEKNRNSVLASIGLDANGNVLTGDKAGALGKQYADVSSQVDQANATRKATDDALKALIAQGQLTPAEMQEFGISKGGGAFTHDAFGRPIAGYDPSGYQPGDQLFDLNLANYANYGSDLNRDQVMTPTQRAYIQALSQLAGHTDDFAANPAQDPSKAYSFDTARFLADQRGRAESFSNDFANLVQAYRNNQIGWDDYLKQHDALINRYQVNRRIGPASPGPTVQIAPAQVKAALGPHVDPGGPQVFVR